APAPRAAAPAAAPAATAPAPAAAAPAPAAPGQPILVHLASYASRADVQRGWMQVSSANPRLWSGLRPSVQEVPPAAAGGRTVYRLLAGPFPSRAAAEAACAEATKVTGFCRIGS
ncbi:MAG TPA: SPOR domain-containing protein, partial [Alphaproteobacteria bacterium]|nr:SPOR domain-containing protein [Alphaproteobacteria bacterium]